MARKSAKGSTPSEGTSLKEESVGAGATPAEKNPQLLVNQKSDDKFKKMWTRTWAGALMIFFFMGILYMGHFAVLAFTMVCQSLVFFEIVSLGLQWAVERSIPAFRLVNYYFAVVFVYFSYGLQFFDKFRFHILSQHKDYTLLLFLERHHDFICFSAYILGFVTFVALLRRKVLHYQFTQFAWTHITIFLVLGSSSFFLHNIMSGLFWMIVPVSLIVINDIMAYFCGFFLGRTPLTALSPKKTVEGFVGGALFTILLAFFIAGALQKFDYITCPRTILNSPSMSCDDHLNVFTQVLSPVFPASFVEGVAELRPQVEAVYWIPGKFFSWVMQALTFEVNASPAQFHAVILALFASIFAPFGGFFASGFKRAFKIKDFGSSLPGHGGLTDRFDCQIVMAGFTYFYLRSWVTPAAHTVSDLMSYIATLPAADQVLLHSGIGSLLEAAKDSVTA